ncbi:hypothetical protein K491DRAFT_710682 [Lophiostoma macrostomum CBS 122681]|uniref:Palmitoyltransferase n=1 Tax=Lophiostoma macrostomum CBS 122681 TaxID=1314788 RepID=A0A6A6TMZ9_9PLEO|nr:hypothetical protein K491DRAFT_710682 [Lophiostoma macrostomum CBS 122681]
MLLFWWFIDNVVQPFLLLAFAAGSQWALSFALPGEMMARPSDDDGTWDVWFVRRSSEWIGGIVVRVSSVLVFFAWFGPLLFLWWSTHIVARRLKVLEAPDRDTMQVSGESSINRRWCDFCNVPKDDRMYHCRRLDKCLPLFDHWCEWFQGCVWAHNVKAYLFFVTFIPVHQLFCLVVGIWALTDTRYEHQLGPQIIVLVLSTIMLPFSFRNARVPWINLVAHNMVWPESLKGLIFLQVGAPGNVIVLDARDPAQNPWNLGFWKNLCLYLGPWYTLPFFWLPSRMYRLDGYPTRADLQPAAVPLQELRIDRRREARSTTGCEPSEDAAHARRPAAPHDQTES